MRISELKSVENGWKVTMTGLVNKIQMLTKKDGTPYVQFRLQDATGITYIPVWQNFESYSELKIGTLISFEAIKKDYECEPQLSVVGTPTIIDKSTVNMSDFVPSYEIPPALMNYFADTVNKMSEPYCTIVKGCTGAYYNAERWLAFTTCVSAEKHHGNKRSGLFLHTVGLMKSVDAIVNNYVTNPFFLSARDVINKDRLMCLAIIHDVKKTQEYEYETTIRRKDMKMDHKLLGASFLAEINKEVGNVLSEEELDLMQYSILAHDGQYGKFEPKSLEDKLLHLVDMIDSQIVGEVEKQ